MLNQTAAFVVRNAAPVALTAGKIAGDLAVSLAKTTLCTTAITFSMVGTFAVIEKARSAAASHRHNKTLKQAIKARSLVSCRLAPGTLKEILVGHFNTMTPEAKAALLDQLDLVETAPEAPQAD